MFRIHRIPSIALASIGLAPAAFAQSFSIDWYTIEPGGIAQGGPFNLACVIGEPEAGLTLTGGVFSLSGGFLAAGSAPPRCPADMDDGSGTGTPDGGVTIDDVLYFLQQFDNGSVSADLDDGTATGTPDGGVSIEDLLYFLQRFSDGC